MLKTLEHRVKAAVFELCRWFLKRGRPDKKPVNPELIDRVLFLRPEKIGDMVISLPVFDALRERFPRIAVSILASPRSLPLVKDDPRFDRVFVYRKRLIRDIRTLLAIRREGFDCVFDMIDDDSVTTLFYSQLAAPRALRIGIGKVRHAAYYDYNHDHPDGIGGHIVDNTMRLLEPFGIAAPVTGGLSHPHVPAGARARVERFLAASVPPGAPVVGINLSAGRPNRIWPPDRSVALAQRLLEDDRDLCLIVVVAPDDRRRGEDLVSRLEERARLLPPGMNLLEVSALIAGLDILISPDTSLIHIARSYNVPVVGLYSRADKNFRRWRPYRQQDGAVVGNHIDDIYDISVDQVLERCRQIRSRLATEQS